MSYTNIDQVRNRLTAAYPTGETIEDQVHQFSSDEFTSFFGGGVDENSVKVKSVQSSDRIRTSLTLSTSTTSIAAAPLVRGSVVVASDSSLGHVYIENIDYVVSYPDGDLIIKSGGGLSIDQTVTVWYLIYILYTLDTDYQLRSQRGEIKRLTGGGIASQESVWLDYSPLWESFNDDVLTNAVVEANGLVEKMIDPDGLFGADPVLQTAATYLALESICRTAAVRDLSGRAGNDRTALAWMKLSEQYRIRADELLRSFSPPQTGPAAPVHS